MGEYLFFGSAITSLANGAVLLYVNPKRPINQVFLVSSIWMSIWACCVAMAIRLGARNPSSPSEALIFWLRFSNASAAFIGWSAWLMRTALLFEGSSFQNILKKSWLFFLVSCIAATIAFSEWYIPSDSTPLNKQRGTGFMVYTLIASISCIYMLWDASRHLKRLTGVRRIEMQFFVTGILCACSLLVISNLLGNVRRLEWFKQVGPLWTFTAHAMAVWAVCYYRVFDAKQVIYSVGQRLTLFGFLALGGLKFSQLLGRYLTQSLATFLVVATSCALAILCDGPMRRILGLDLKCLLLAPRRKIIEWARQFPDETELAAKFEMLLRDWCQTNRVYLISEQSPPTRSLVITIPKNWNGLIPICNEGWVTPESLQRKRSALGTSECADYLSLNNLGAILAVPKGSKHPSLLVFIGQKYSKRPYTFPDIQMLFELSELMDNILTHSRVSAHATRIEKMASAAMMSRGLAHDLNNLATPVSTFLLHMETRVIPEGPEAVVLADAKHSMKVMQEYIQESLFLGRQHVPNYGSVSALGLLSSVARLTHGRARTAGVSVIVRTVEDFYFPADFVLIQRALQNLVFNGIDASGPSTTVEVSAAITNEHHVHLSVSDHGTGIAPGIRGQVFEPYFTTKNTGNALRGLGLGLAICKMIAELHDGVVTIANNEPKGAIFRMILPLKRSFAVIHPTTEEGDSSRLSPLKPHQEARQF